MCVRLLEDLALPILYGARTTTHIWKAHVRISVATWRPSCNPCCCRRGKVAETREFFYHFGWRHICRCKNVAQHLAHLFQSKPPVFWRPAALLLTVFGRPGPRDFATSHETGGGSGLIQGTAGYTKASFFFSLQNGYLLTQWKDYINIYLLKNESI